MAARSTTKKTAQQTEQLHRNHGKATARQRQLLHMSALPAQQAPPSDKTNKKKIYTDNEPEHVSPADTRPMGIVKIYTIHSVHYVRG